MGLADLMEIEQERVDIVQRSDAFIQRAHNRRRVFSQFFAVRLLVSRRQLMKFRKQTQQFFVLFKQSEIYEYTNMKILFPKFQEYFRSYIQLDASKEVVPHCVLVNVF